MTTVEILIDGQKCTGTIKEDSVILVPSEPKARTKKGFSNDKVSETEIIYFEDIICFKYEGSLQTLPLSGKTVIVLHFIRKKDDVPQWKNVALKMAPCPGQEDAYTQFVKGLQVKFEDVLKSRPRKILVLMNPVSGDHKANKVYDSIVLPLFQLAGISVELIVSERHKNLIEVISSYEYKSVDGIVMIGGDGTLQQVMNVLIKRTQGEAGIDFNDSSAVLQPVPIPLSIIPTGSGNGVAIELTGCADVITSTLHIIRGKSHDFDIFSTHCNGKLVGYGACLMGLGAFSDFFYMADGKFRWMKTSRYNAATNMYLFRRVHYLDAEITLYNRQTENLQAEGDMTNADTTKEDSLIKRTSMIMVSALDVLYPERKRERGKMFVTIYEEMGSFQMRRTWRKFLRLKDPHLRESREANSMAIRFKPRPNAPRVYNEMVCVDGELFTCSKPEYFVRVLQGVVQMM